MKKFFWVFIVLLFAWGGCNNDNSTQNLLPSITGMAPNQVGNGQANVQGTITGENLSGVTKVDLGAGITVKDFHSVSATQVSVTFDVDGNAAAGPRNVTVTTAAGSAGASVLSVVISNKPPVAKFAVKPDKGDTNTIFTFDASKSHDPDGRVASYAWDFGDGKKGNGKVVDHKFENKGKFPVELTIKDNKGLASKEVVNLNVDKATAIVCTHKLSYKRVGVFGTVLEVDGADYKWRTDTAHDCSNTYYYCGDFSNPSETEYYGTLCGLTYLGANTFIVHTQHKSVTPPVGQKAFIKAQKCKYDPCAH